MIATSTFRTSALRQAPTQGVDSRERIIYGAKVIQLGRVNDDRPFEVDRETLEQVVQFGNSSNKGLKARFTHPNMCDDGMGKYLGRWKDFRVMGDSVYADLHLSEVAQETPQGDLAQYVMNLATEDPESFGVSVAVSFSDEMLKALDELEPGQLTALRISGLRGADVVDEPAATRGGFFAMGGQPQFDMNNKAAVPSILTWLVDTHFHSVEPAEMIQRFVEFASKYYERDVMSELVSSSEVTPTTDAIVEADVETTEEVQTETVQFSNEDAQRFIECFGDRGARWYIEGRTIEECFREENEELKNQLCDMQEKNEDLQARLSVLVDQVGESDELSSGERLELSEEQIQRKEKAEHLKNQGASDKTARWASAFTKN